MSALMAAILLMAAAPATAETSRLAGLARVWGHVKYVHPAMATTSIDWDAALIRAIPVVEKARSDQEYREAVASVLAELRDPVTRVVERDAAAASAPVPARAALELEMLDADTVTLKVLNEPALEANPELRAELCARFSEAARFERVILDLRSPAGRSAGFGLKDAIVKCAGRLLDRDVTLPPARFLRHGFYMMQGVAGGPGGGLGPWESGLEVVSSGSVRAEASRAPRLAFIVDRGSIDLFPLLMALQAHGLAKVVQVGDIPSAGVMVKPFRVDEKLTIAVRHGEWLRPDGGAGFKPNVVVSTKGGDVAQKRAISLLASPQRGTANVAVPVPFGYGAFVERDYSETPFPDRAHRLLALFRMYAVIERFFPYRDLMDRPWDETLLEFIPRMLDARDATDYALTVAELGSRLQDSHVTVASPVLDAYFGTHRPAVRVDLMEGATVVTEVAPAAAESGIAAGDVLLSVDGEEIAPRRARLARYLSASTLGRLENKVDTQLLLGPRSNPTTLEVRGQDGAVRRGVLPRTVEGPAPRARPRNGPTYSILPEGFGYIDLERLVPSDVDAAFELVLRTPGLILDMRGYPSSAAWQLIPRLTRGRVRAAVMGGSPRYSGSSGAFSREEGSALLVEPAPGEKYTGRVVVLADSSSQSAAETVCLMLKAATGATFVGTQTSGANGGVTRTILPGGIVLNFTGYAVQDADGGQFQRVGVVPDIEARPTLLGICEGRDELLERAIAFLRLGR
jgi:C-terminal processing protease CtpA/Prc